MSDFEIKPLLQKLSLGKSLTESEAEASFDALMTGQLSPAQVGGLLGMIQVKGPATSELIGAAKVMRAKVVPIEVPEDLMLVDTCGTGGDKTHTFNVSTTAALVVAGAGSPEIAGGDKRELAVAKHGNRSVTSQSGSSQVLEALGVNLNVEMSKMSECLEKAGICFCFAPNHHPAMKHAGPIRAELGIRTIFNLLGPLTNPAGVKRQVIGVYDGHLVPQLAEVLKALGSESAMIVHGRATLGGKLCGMDELSISSASSGAWLKEDGTIKQMQWTPSDWGIENAPLEQLQATDVKASAEIIGKILDGEKGPCRDIVLVNAASALMVAGKAASIKEGVGIAAQAIDEGAAKKSLETLVEVSK